MWWLTVVVALVCVFRVPHRSVCISCHQRRPTGPQARLGADGLVCGAGLMQAYASRVSAAAHRSPSAQSLSLPEFVLMCRDAGIHGGQSGTSDTALHIAFATSNAPRRRRMQYPAFAAAMQRLAKGRGLVLQDLAERMAASPVRGEDARRSSASPSAARDEVPPSLPPQHQAVWGSGFRVRRMEL